MLVFNSLADLFPHAQKQSPHIGVKNPIEIRSRIIEQPCTGLTCPFYHFWSVGPFRVSFISLFRSPRQRSTARHSAHGVRTKTGPAKCPAAVGQPRPGSIP